jgi:hypothetical protein
VSSATLAAPRRAAGPLWAPRQIAALLVALALGIAGLVVGWAGTANSAATTDAVPWVTLTVGGVLLAVFAGALWVLALRRRIGLRRALLLPAALTTLAAPAAVPAQPPAARASTQLVASERMRFFHRPECRLVGSKEVQAANRATHDSEGRTACPVCAP